MPYPSALKLASLRLPPAGLLGAGLSAPILRARELPLVFGTGSHGHLFARDLVAMPHFLAAGCQNEKKAFLQALVASLLANRAPSEFKLALVDSAASDFAEFAGLPHLASPIAKSQSEALSALEAAAAEMDRRYSLIAKVKGRNIVWYNAHLGELKHQDASLEALSRLVVFVSDLSSLDKQSADILVRLAQLGAPCGIHCIVGTTSAVPSVVSNVILGNFPCRACMKVGTAEESVNMLGLAGAEQIPNPGEMLFLPRPVAQGGEILRVQGAFPSEFALQSLCAWWKAHASA